MQHPNNQHAERLREMAKGAKEKSRRKEKYALAYFKAGYVDLAKSFQETAQGHMSESAALLAGANALEAIEAYNEHISSNWDTEDEAYRKFRAALARLEGK